MIDVSGLDELSLEQLVELNRIVIAKIEEHRQNRAKKALSVFKIGDRVRFKDPDGHPYQGVVVRVNQKTLTIDTKTGTYRVPPVFVDPIIKGKKKANVFLLPKAKK